MKKIFTLFAALAMVMSMFAATPEKLYLTPNSNWKTDNARFAAYFFGNGEKWVSMTKVANETDLYEVTVPAGFSKVIFCRMNPSASANNWNNKWNQTGDLTIPTDGKNHCTIKAGQWNCGTNLTWSIWPEPAQKTYKDITITITANAEPSIKWWNAGDKLSDGGYVAMTATGAEKTYSYTLAQVDEAKGVEYSIKVGSIEGAAQQTSANVTADFKEMLAKVAVMGVNNWDGTDVMTASDDYLSASITLPLTAKKYELKLTVDGQWVGDKNNITRDNNSSVFENNGDNGSITADLDGDYVFTYTYANKTLVVTYPVLVQTINLSYDITSENIGNRMGRQTISVEDENYGNPQLVIEGFSVEVAEYTEASLSINDETLKATATYTVDAESGTEVYTATATTADGSIIYNVTFTYVLPTTQNYELYAMGLSATVESEDGYTAYYMEGEAILGEELIPVEFMVDNFGNAEGMIGDIFALGMGEAEQEGTSLFGVVLLEDESGNTYRIEFVAEIEQPEVEIVVKEEVDVVLYNLNVEPQGTMGLVSAGTEELSFWLTLLPTENYYGGYMSDAFSNIWYNDEQLYSAYGDMHLYGVDTDDKVKFVVSFITTPDAEGNVTKYNFTLYPGDKPSDATGVDNLNSTVAPIKAIINGQLIISNNGVQYNAQGAILK